MQDITPETFYRSATPEIIVRNACFHFYWQKQLDLIEQSLKLWDGLGNKMAN
jgi:hypothetical protein